MSDNKDRCAALEEEVDRNGCLLTALGEELEQARHERRHALLRADRAETCYTHACIYLYTLEELATNVHDDLALHLIACWRGSGDDLKPWARDLRRCAWTRTFEEGRFEAPGGVAAADALKSFGDDRYAEGKSDGLAEAVGAIAEACAACSAETRAALERVRETLEGGS